MRRTLAKVLCMIILMSVLSVPAALSAGGTTLVLPAKLKEISAQAFMGDTSVVEVEIPSTTTKIDSKAFSGCSKLTKVTILNNNITIADDAFSNCPNVTLYVYSNSKGEAYARQYNIRYQLIYDENLPTYLKAREMVGRFSSSGTGLQGGDDRLIVRMKNGVSLPDISAYNPVSIIKGERDIYFIQFGSSSNAANCRAAINGRSDKMYVEYDKIDTVDNRGEDGNAVSASGIMTWDDDDPMGFDTYAPYVIDHQSGSQMIAIIDTGVKKNAVYNSMLSSKSINMLDDGQDAFYSGRDHASQIASIIHDCVGGTNVKLLSIRAVDDQEQTDSMLFGQSIAYAVDAGADIINISYLFPKSSYVEDEMSYAVSQGVKIIVAAGNQNGSTSEAFPANAHIDDLIVVSGLDDLNHLWSRTNTGPEVVYCAPASGIKTSLGNIGEGTSFAAPMIAAAYALVNLDTTHTIKDMRNTCNQDISTGNKTQAIGYGMPQLQKLAPIKVIDIVLSGVPSKMKVGDSATITYAVKPDNASDKTISFTSSNTAAITITRGTGNTLKLKGEGKGKSTITISANDDSGVKKQFDVPVIQPVTKITVSADSYETDLQHTLTMKLKVEPSNADNAKVKWTSSKTGVATVSQSGVVTPVAAGETVIRADAQDGYGAHHEVTVKVIDIPDPVSIDIIANGCTLEQDGAIELQPGEGLQLSAKVNPDKAVQTVAWSVKSVPSGVVTIDTTGYLKAVKAGTAFVTATSTVNGSVHTDVGVLVQVMPVSIDISGPGVVKVGENITLTATVNPSDATNKNVIWQCSNGKATVSQSGVVTGIANGEVEITATSEGDNKIIGRKNIVVQQMPKSISISGTTKIFINNDDPDHPAQNASQLTATVSPSDTYDKSVTWSSSDTNVATVDKNGIVTTVAPGTAKITVKSKVDSSITASVQVAVQNKWKPWTDYTETPITQTDSRQVQTRIKYRYRDTYLTWWVLAAGSIDTSSEICEIQWQDNLYLYYYFVCPNCGRHWNRCDFNYYPCKCGYNEYNLVYDEFYDPTPVEGLPELQLMSTYKKFVLHSENEWERAFTGEKKSKGRGYRYKLWNAYQYSYDPVDEVNTTDYTKKVDPITEYRYRDQNTFDAPSAPKDYTYDVVYRSSNGTDLGSSSATYKSGTTNTISAPRKAGYDTPASQAVQWDATSKTITFVYTPSWVGYTTASAVWSNGPKEQYYVEIQYRNRTADSVEISVYWKNTMVEAGWDSYEMRFLGSCKGVEIPSTTVVPFGAWKAWYGSAREASANSAWIRVPLSTTGATSVDVHLEMHKFNVNGTNMTYYSGREWANVNMSVAIPAY